MPGCTQISGIGATFTDRQQIVAHSKGTRTRVDNFGVCLWAILAGPNNSTTSSTKLFGLAIQTRCQLIMCQVILCMFHVLFYLSLYQHLVCPLQRSAVRLPCGLGDGGEHFDSVTQSCKPCAVGMFLKAWKSKLEDCHKEDTAKSTSRVGLNSSALYCEKDVPTKCFSCDNLGRYQDAEGKTECHPCPDHAKRPIGSNFTSIRNCKEHMPCVNANISAHIECLHRCL